MNTRNKSLYSSLISRLEDHNIVVKDNFYALLRKIERSLCKEEYIEKRDSLRSEIYDHLFLVCTQANSTTTRTTSLVTGIYASAIPSLMKKQYFEDTPTIISKHYWKSVTGMQNGRGLPSLKELEELHKFCDDSSIPFTSVTGMQSRKGIPCMNELTELVSLLAQHRLDIVGFSTRQLGVTKTLELVKTITQNIGALKTI